MKNKMITLCDETYELAKAIPNFSEWVLRPFQTFLNGSALSYWRRMRREKNKTTWHSKYGRKQVNGRSGTIEHIH